MTQALLKLAAASRYLPSELWVVVKLDNRFITTRRVFQYLSFQWQWGARWIQIRFRMDSPHSSYAEGAVFDKLPPAEFRRLKFYQNNELEEGFVVRVYRTEQEARNAPADFARQVEPAMYQGYNP